MGRKREEATEATILSVLLDSHPVARTMPELVRVLEKDRDEVNRALCALADYGLLEFEGGRTETLRPTLAARSCRRLLSADARRGNPPSSRSLPQRVR